MAYLCVFTAGMLNICNTIQKIRRRTLCRRENDLFTFTIFNNSSAITGSDWNNIGREHDFFMSLPYLSLLEKLQQVNTRFVYVIVYKNAQPALKTIFQINDFTTEVFGNLLEDHLSEVSSKRKRLFSHYLYHKKEKEVIVRLLTGGNNFLSGDYGLVYSGITRQEAFDVLEAVIKAVWRHQKLHGKILATLVKDFPIRLTAEPDAELSEAYTPFIVEPNMLVDLPGGIDSLEDYIALFSKKYRNRARGILKTGSVLVRKELNAIEAESLKRELYLLYEKVYEKAKFKLVKLSPDYFSEFKKAFPEQFLLHAYFLNEKLVAFDSAFLPNTKILDAHYIGFDYALNKEYDIYQNMLYAYIQDGIRRKCTMVNLGRTAAEIKSTVGARPYPLRAYFRAQNTMSRFVLKPFISFLQPDEWVPRNPFNTEKKVESPSILLLSKKQ